MIAVSGTARPLRWFAARGALLTALLAAALSPALAAQSPIAAVARPAQGGDATSAAHKNEEISVVELKKNLADAQAELAAIDNPERLAAGAPPGTPEKQLQQRVRALRIIAFSYRQHINALGKLAELKKLSAEVETRRRARAEPAQKPPYSLIVVDGMRAEMQAAALELRSEETRQILVAAQTENAKESLAKASERQRQAQEALEAAKPAGLSAATWLRDLAALEARAQGVYLEALAAMSRTVEAGIAEYKRQASHLRRQLDDAAQSVVFTPEDIARLMADIEARRTKAIQALDVAARERERVAAEVDQAIAQDDDARKQVLQLEQRVAETRKAVTMAQAAVAKAANPEGFLQKANPFRGRSEQAELDKYRNELVALEKDLGAARRLAVARDRALQLVIERNRNAAQRVESLNTGLVALEMQRAFWELRYAAYNEKVQGAADRRKMKEGSQRLLKVLNPAIEYLRSKLEIIVGQMAEQQNLLRATSDSDETVLRKEVISLLVERERTTLAVATEVEEVRHLLVRWVDEENLRTEDQTAGERAQNWLSATKDGLKAIWTYEIFTVEDSIVVEGRTLSGTRGVTVAKIVQAILIVVLGYALVALLSRYLMAVAIRTKRMEETSARIARKWILAVMLVIFLLLALDVVKIPLTAFAFLGGAIAIGAGFGMQTLLKNLISGVMLLMERPFKPRDIVEVGGIRGEVTDINVRSCTIRDVNGIETLVPNSTFLEQNVTNWTLSSRQVRYALNIGVGYGSPVRKVSDLLLEVAARHKQVLKEPAPEVLFVDFGDNALMFVLYVWLEVGPGRRSGNVILSDLRFMIDASFAENNIEIPFPQRSVHLDAASPIPVRVMPAEGAS